MQDPYRAFSGKGQILEAWRFCLDFPPMFYMKYEKRMNKYEKRDAQREKHAKNFHGEGIYVFRNASAVATFDLPKPSISGTVRLQPNEEFQGDNYFMAYVGKGLRLVREIQAPLPVLQEQNEPKELIMETQKLILDQPDTISNQGTVEHIVTPAATPKPKKVNEQKKGSDVLLVEDPLQGIEILVG